MPKLSNSRKIKVALRTFKNIITSKPITVISTFNKFMDKLGKDEKIIGNVPYVRLYGKRMDTTRKIWKFPVDEKFTEQQIENLQNSHLYTSVRFNKTDMYNKTTEVFDSE